MISLAFEDRHRRQAGRSIDMGITDPGVVRHLPAAAATAQLHCIFVYLPQPRRTDRFAAGEATAVGVDRQLAADLAPALGEPLFLVAVGAEAVFGHVHDLGARFGVLQL